MRLAAAWISQSAGMSSPDVHAPSSTPYQVSSGDSGTRLGTLAYLEDAQFEALAEPEAQLRPVYDVSAASYDPEVTHQHTPRGTMRVEKNCG